MRGRSAALIALLALAPAGPAFSEVRIVGAQGLREGQLRCAPLFKEAIEQKCDRNAFEFPQDGRVDGWRIVLLDRDRQRWAFSRADVMLANMPAPRSSIHPLRDTESGIRH